jgi:hypothetical protein
MTRAIAILTVCTLFGPVGALAQTPEGQPASATPPTLAEVAKTEEARRKSVQKPAKVYTNNSLKPDISPSRPAAAPPPPSTTVPEINLPGGTAGPADTSRDQAYWSGRISTARAALDRSRIFADSLQSRINALTTDFVNRDDPVQKAKIEADRKTALAELDKVKLEIVAQEKEIQAIEDEARKAGVPSGWLRPAA